MRFTLFAVILFILALLPSCQPPEPSNHPSVVATTTLLADAARQLAKELVTVECLMGPGIDPHRYTASPGDLHRLESARLILYHGLHLEGKMNDVLAQHPRRNTLAVAEQLEPARLLPAAGDGPYDPHIWMDPTLWAEAVSVIARALTETFPEHAPAFRRNAEAYIAELHKLHEENQQRLAIIPPHRRILATSHDAFAYFGRAYKLQVRGLQGVSTVAEAGTRDVQELAEFLGTHQVPAVFAETSVPPKGLQTVLDVVRQRHQYVVRLLGGDHALYSDSLGPPGSSGATYLGMMRHNVATIADALR